jgi:hypothetical protein
MSQRHWFLAAIVLLAAVLVFQGLRKGGAFREGKLNDFWAYHVAARGIWAGDLIPSYEDPQRTYLYPPTFACAVAPLGLLTYRGALVIWVVLNGLLVVWVGLGLERVLSFHASAWGRLAALLLVVRPLEADFSNGNANLLVLAILLGSFELARRGRPVLAGGALALAILSKVSPVLVLPWAFSSRRWSYVGGAALGLAFWGLLVPGLVLGPRGLEEAWRAWAGVTLRHMDPRSTSYAEEPAGGYEPGQSLRALLHRLLRRSDATAHDEAAISIHLADLPKGAADAAYGVSALALLTVLCLSGRKWKPLASESWSAREVAAALAAMVVLAPLSRKAHFVALWPAALVGFEAWRRSERKTHRWVGALLWASALLLVVGTSPDLAGRLLATRLLAYCPMSFAAACLIVLVASPRLWNSGEESAGGIRETSLPPPPGW